MDNMKPYRTRGYEIFKLPRRHPEAQRPALPSLSVSVTYAQTGSSTKSDELGMWAMQERAYEKQGEQYLLIKSPPPQARAAH